MPRIPGLRDRMYHPPSDTRDSRERKRRVLVVVVIFLACIVALLAVLFGYESTSSEVGLLEARSGDVRVQTAESESTWIAASTGMELHDGDWLWVGEGSAAIIHYFDGSRTLLQGSGQLQLVQSQKISKIIGADRVRVETRLVSGRATSQIGQEVTTFVVRTPTGAIHGRDTVLATDADTGEYINWRDGDGSTIVSGLAVDTEGHLVVAMVPISGGTSLVVPPLPQDITNGEPSGLADELRKVATDLLRAAADSGHEVVDVSGTELLNSDPDTGSASYRISEALLPSGIGLSQREPADVGHLGSVVIDDVLATVDFAVVKSLVLAIPAVPAMESEDSGEGRGPVDAPEYQFSIYGVDKPLGVAVHPDGEFIYVAESGGERGVHVFDRDGTHLATLVPTDSKNVASRSPVYVGVHRTTGRIFVSDRTRSCIDVYDYSGAHVERLSPDEFGDIWSPMAMTFDDRTSNWDDLYITELTSGQHRVMVFDYAGHVRLEFGKKGEGVDEFSFPNGIAVDSLGNIYVADSNNFALKVFDQDGSNPRAIDAGLPRGLAVDERDLLHVVDVFGHSVIVFQAGESLQRLFTFGGQGMGAGEFNYPNGIALDSAGRVYVTDRENNRVQVWQY